MPNPPRSAQDWPRGVYGLRVLSALAKQGQLSGLPWDDDGTLPDTFLRLYIDGKQVWQSEVAQDDDSPTWNAGLPRNIVVPETSSFRLELWDWDTMVSADAMGHIERRGLPGNVTPGTESRLTLNSGAVVTLMLTPPLPRRGIGLRVELRPEYLKVLSVEPYSPAARGGIKSGDHIVGIGGTRVSQLGEDKAASELSLVLDRGAHTLQVADASGAEREVALDQGYVWQVM